MRPAAEYVGGTKSAERVTKGTATGAAGALTMELIHSREPNPVFKRFVEKCLREKGYEPIGWK